MVRHCLISHARWIENSQLTSGPTSRGESFRSGDRLDRDRRYRVVSRGRVSCHRRPIWARVNVDVGITTQNFGFAAHSKNYRGILVLYLLLPPLSFHMLNPTIRPDVSTTRSLIKLLSWTKSLLVSKDGKRIPWFIVGNDSWERERLAPSTFGNRPLPQRPALTKMVGFLRCAQFLGHRTVMTAAAARRASRSRLTIPFSRARRHQRTLDGTHPHIEEPAFACPQSRPG